MKSLSSKIVLLVAALWLPFSAHAAKNILVFGDSLSAGYGIAIEKSWVNLLQQELKKTHPQFSVVNASISGETTSGGLRRIGRALKQFHPAIVIVELGANDGLRGAPIRVIEANLDKIIEQIAALRREGTAARHEVAAELRRALHHAICQVYPRLAKKHRIALLPFMLEGVPPEQFQADNLHPAADAQPLIMRHVLHSLIPLLN